MNEFGIVQPTAPAIELEHPAHDLEHLTAVVLGLPFSGTSMVAAVVDALGVPFVKSDEFWFAYEASEFNNRPLEQVRESIDQWNKRHPVWGFKDPHAKRHDAAEFHASLRNPHYVIVTKDLASMTARLVQNPIRPDDGGTPIDRLRYEIAEQIAFMQWVLTLPPAPKLLVSYHAALRNPGSLCIKTAAFLHLELTARLLDGMLKAVDRISPTGGYLMKEEDGR